MINKILLFICLFTLSSCIQDPNGFLRKSANNKYFDTRGFHDSKRLPVYNGKYIERAKQNMLSGNYNRELELYEAAEEKDEVESPSTYHREIYKQMLLEEKDPRSKASSNSNNVVLDDFGDEIAFEDDMDIQEKVAKSEFLQENISNNFVEDSVERNLKLELEEQKKEFHKELQEMRAMLELIRNEIVLAKNGKGSQEMHDKKRELSLNQKDNNFEIHRTFLLY